MVAKGKVSLPWQIVGTILPPTGIYAFTRIKKGKYGIIIYVVTYCLGILHELTKAENVDIFQLLTAFSLLLSAVIIPIYFMAKWSKEWNNSIDKQNIPNA